MHMCMGCSIFTGHIQKVIILREYMAHAVDCSWTLGLMVWGSIPGGIGHAEKPWASFEFTLSWVN